MDPFRLIDLEPDADGSGDAGGTGDGDAGSDAAAADADTDAQATPTISPEDFQAMQSELAELRAAMTADDDEGEGIVPNPFDDDFKDQLDAYFEQRMAGVTSYQQQQQLAEANERAMDIIADITSREGDFIMPEQSKQLARDLGEKYLPEFVDKMGYGPKAAEAALAKGVKEAKALEEQIGKAYHDRQVNEIATLSGARREPPASGQAGTTQTTIPQGDERSVVGKYFQ